MIITKDFNGEYKIYVHINKINKKMYIGQTHKELQDRCGCKGANYKHSRHFWNAIQKYGWNNFDHIIVIDGISLKLANILEEELIKKYNTMDRRYGYNMIAGGNNKKRRQEVTDRIAEKNRHPSPETLRKMSIASTGRKHSPEVIEKIRQSNRGKKRSDEAKLKMSIAKQNMSEETRKKISEAGKGRKVSQKCIEINRKRFIGNRLRIKPVAQYDFDGIFIKAWECAMDVEKELRINHGNIGKCCNGNEKSAGGYQWKYYYGDKSNIEPIKNNDRSVKVDQYDLQGNFIKTYESINCLNKKYKYAPSNIRKCCDGKIQSAYGYIWRRHGDKPPKKYKNTHCKMIVQFDLDMNYIKVWKSIKEASDELKIPYSTIQECCNRKSSKSSNGFLWRYIDDVDEIILKEVG